MVFNRKRRESKETWKWRDKDIEEDFWTFKYLGYTLNIKGNYKSHLKELHRKGRMAARKVWRLGEMICRDFLRGWMLFKYLVQSIMSV